MILTKASTIIACALLASSTTCTSAAKNQQQQQLKKKADNTNLRAGKNNRKLGSVSCYGGGCNDNEDPPEERTDSQTESPSFYPTISPVATDPPTKNP